MDNAIAEGNALMSSGIRFRPSSFRHLAWSDKGQRQARLAAEAPLGSPRTVAVGSKSAFNWVCFPHMFPVLGGEVVKRQQRVTAGPEKLDKGLRYVPPSIGGTEYGEASPFYV